MGMVVVGRVRRTLLLDKKEKLVLPYFEAEILGTVCVLAGSDPTREVRSGFIHFRAPVIVFQTEIL